MDGTYWIRFNVWIHGSCSTIFSKVFKNFESQFTEVYPDFFKSLVLRYGKLSQNDLRLCAYIKMNQTTNQIAQITGVSIRTVETQRYRLGKKLKLAESEDLNSTIISI